MTTRVCGRAVPTLGGPWSSARTGVYAVCPDLPRSGHATYCTARMVGEQLRDRALRPRSFTVLLAIQSQDPTELRHGNARTPM